MSAKLEQLCEYLRAHAPVAIAYSGGVDSAFLLAFAHQVLGDKCLGVIADSASLPRQALADALELAKKIGVPVRVLETREMLNPDYISNPPNRCYFCKAELFQRMDELARAEKFAAIAYGENADDAMQVRPGVQAAREFAVIAPLKAVGLTKAEIREHSRSLNLPTADAPAQPCLSSRIPHGTPVSLEALSMVERSEAFVRKLGFKVLRVRHLAGGPAQPPRARVQIGADEMIKVENTRAQLVDGLVNLGYVSVEIEEYKTSA